MKPVIGLTSYFVNAYEHGKDRVRGMVDQDIMMSTMDYSESVLEAGGIPVAIAPIDSELYLEGLVSNLDGLLLTGGGDINPRLYAHPFKKGMGKLEDERDRVEIKLIELALKRGLPIFGICRGFQLLNVYFGGTLIQDIDRYYDTLIEHVGNNGLKSSIAHEISLVRECDLKKCFDDNTVQVNSFHHQIVDKVGDGLNVCAMSEDGIIEAFEHSKNNEIFGVQWHPEMMTKIHKEQLGLFKLLTKYSSGTRMKKDMIYSG